MGLTARALWLAVVPFSRTQGLNQGWRYWFGIQNLEVTVDTEQMCYLGKNDWGESPVDCSLGLILDTVVSALWQLICKKRIIKVLIHRVLRGFSGLRDTKCLDSFLTGRKCSVLLLRQIIFLFPPFPILLHVSPVLAKWPYCLHPLAGCVCPLPSPSWGTCGLSTFHIKMKWFHFEPH